MKNILFANIKFATCSYLCHINQKRAQHEKRKRHQRGNVQSGR